MKRLQHSGFGKLLAWLILIAGTFVGTGFGLRLIQALPYVTADHYRDSVVFYQEMTSYCQSVSDYLHQQALLEQNESDYASDYILRHQLEQNMAELEKKLDAGSSSFRFQVRTADGSQIVMDNLNRITLEKMVPQVYYLSFEQGAHFYTNYYSSPDMIMEYTNGTGTHPQYILEYGVHQSADQSQGDDPFSHIAYVHTQETELFPLWVTMTAACLSAALAAAVYLLWTAGHKKGEDGILLTWQDRIWLELYLTVSITAECLGIALLVVLVEEVYIRIWNSGLLLPQLKEEWMLIQLGFCLLAVGVVLVLVMTLRTFSVRLKAHALLRTCLLYRICGWFRQKIKSFGLFLRKLLHALPYLWKTILFVCGYMFFNSLLANAVEYSGPATLCWLLLNAAVLALVGWWCIGFRRVRMGCAAITAGNLSHQIELNRLPAELMEHARDLNNLSEGMNNAVNEQMKSERFKAELITNVSHDLKTPLTSIINYVDLLKNTQQTDPKAEEYIQVLDRKAQRLKKLTEDLVEASKASTGTMPVCREKIGMSQLIDQALGEYTEKLESRHLQVITSLPEEETYVYADGRHLWRVVDNLLSNCCKYAMEGTRVYLELTRGHAQVVLSVKNISREPLNISADQLMERFVRGEESRSTDGSGLGLSIARSLTELQGGSFQVMVDGDLFKAVVTIPQSA